MNTRYPSVPHIIGAHPQFKYSAPWSECRIIHEHSCMGTRLLIVGDPDSGGYEWVILTSGQVESHSNDGYGISEVALRDGLIAAFKDCFSPPITPAPAAAPTAPQTLLAADLPASVLEILNATVPPEILELLTWPLLPEAEFQRRHSAVLASLHNGHGSAGHTLDDPSWQAAPQCAASPTPTGQSPVPPALTTAPTAESAAEVSPPSPERPTLPGSAGIAQVESSSSAHDGDACGDINCDGHSKPQMLRPRLIYRIDICKTEDDARREESLATPAQRRMAARFLQVDLHDLTGALTRRVRTRLQQAA